MSRAWRSGYGRRCRRVNPPVYVINLDRAPARLAHAERELAGQGIAFRRLRGRRPDLTDAEIARVYDAARNRGSYHAALQKGEIACFLSHRRAWSTFLANRMRPSPSCWRTISRSGPAWPGSGGACPRGGPELDVVKLYGGHAASSDCCAACRMATA